jgi:hypothetical protein
MAPNPVPAESVPTPHRREWLLHAAVVVLILFSAALLYRQFLRAAPGLWYTSGHDRNGHYLRSQHMAFAFRQGSLAGVIREIHSATVWPPLHPLLTGAVLAVGGIDYRLAVLTSLAAWAATCWLVFALARRLAPTRKALAGAVALVLVLASPAYRAFAGDIMLESMGAALTLGVLYFYVSARQDGSAWRGRAFALLGLALFLTKYNYWTLVVAGLLLGTLLEFGPFLYAALRARWDPASWLRWLAAQLRHPLTYALLAACGVTLYVHFAGHLTITWAGRTATIGRIDIPVEVAYVLLLLRVFPWWRRSGRDAVNRLPALGQQLVRWHGYPLAVWFLWPRRLGVFLWYTTFTDHGRAVERSGWLGNLPYYWQCLSRDYHANLASVVIVLALIALAVAFRRRWTTGTLTVFVFLAAAALLTNFHPSNRSRFLHSWLAVSWVAAGAGAALTAERLAGLVRLRGSFRFAGPALAGGAAAALAAVQGAALVGPGHTEEGGPRPGAVSILPLADQLRPELERARHPAVACNEPFDQLLDWRLGEDHDIGARLPVPPEELLTAPGADRLPDWLRQHSCDLVLVMDQPGSPLVRGFDPAHLRALLAASGDFVLEREWPARAGDGISAQLWRPAGTSPPSSLISQAAEERRP